MGYPAEDIKKPLPSRKKPGFNKLRASITPGTVLILLSGPYRGRRVIFLKQLPSGLLLVTGPFKVNGVPLRRDKQEKEPLSAERKADQESIDKAILAIVKKTDYMKGYLQTRFTLTNGVYPHAISF